MPEQIKTQFAVSFPQDTVRPQEIGPHRPSSDQPWFMCTQEHLRQMMALPLCAVLLWGWLLARGPGGKALNVDLNDFQTETAIYRQCKRPYSMRQIRNALSILEEFGLVSTKENKVAYIANHVGPIQPMEQRRSGGKKLPQVEENFHHAEKNFHLGKKISKSEPKTVSGEDLQLSTDLYTDLLQTTTEDVVVGAVSEGMKQPNSLVPIQELMGSTCTDEAPIEDQFSADGRSGIFDEIEDMGIQINSRLESLVRSATIEVLRDALAVVRNGINQGTARVPAVMLERAIAGKWKPEKSETAGKAPFEFTRWMDIAKDKGIAQASTLDKGILWVLMGDNWKTWDEARILYPLAN